MPEPTDLTSVEPGPVEIETSLQQASAEQLLVADDLVIEEVSIDGMCGVY